MFLEITPERREDLLNREYSAAAITLTEGLEVLALAEHDFQPVSCIIRSRSAWILERLSRIAESCTDVSSQLKSMAMDAISIKTVGLELGADPKKDHVTSVGFIGKKRGKTYEFELRWYYRDGVNWLPDDEIRKELLKIHIDQLATPKKPVKIGAALNSALLWDAEQKRLLEVQEEEKKRQNQSLM